MTDFFNLGEATGMNGDEIASSIQGGKLQAMLGNNIARDKPGDVCTVTAGAWVSDLTNVINLYDSGKESVTLFGGYPIDDGVNLIMKSATVAAGNTGYPNAYGLVNAIEFNTSATLIRLKFYVGGGYAQYTSFRVSINGIYNNITPNELLDISGTAAGSSIYIDIDLSQYVDANGDCSVRFEVDGSVNFKTVSYDSGAVWKSSVEKKKCVAYADSFGAYGAGISESVAHYPINNIYSRTIRMLGMEPTCSSVGGTGYLNDGGTNYTLASTERLDDLTLQNFDVVITSASVNDNGGTLSALTTAQLTALNGIRSRLPAALIVVTSAINNEKAGGYINQASLDAFTQFDDSNSVYIDASTWITASNSAVMVAPDSTHLSHAGESYCAELLAYAIMKATNKA